MSGFSTARLKMVDGQVRTNDVTDRRILDAMLTVPREAFVPIARQALAYLDLDLDVSEGGAKRFLIKPQLTGKLLQAAEIGEGDNVLVVGCATGYLAALTARLARQVTATECDSALAAKAKDACASLANVTCKAAACAEGDPSAAPYDVIILNGAFEVTPEALLGQLKEGGRLVGVSAQSTPPRAVIVTHTHGEFGHRALFDAAAPVLPGLERAAAFVF
ncbi:protein-L-isoaspartate(D-aspartate) O-methyltransferase [Bradyrhizobium sp. JR7.2]|jgi:protein-L-isoaspartate(D-aspartate) O-methyltransferase|uniref:Protein-L-isoaspartate O-methyltransferase n=2 Tax=Bradyrhizobium TaxID=374 RepID=A0A1Y2JUH9_BRAJP|nr:MULTISPECIES: protein-L-isoaspartate O-methyltransferase [Bradyrhizobium]OSJ34863.1 protein-L-isoaspartate O-methyltransferase [Bradyrhizobium japonicum]UFW82911.1 protein-L-isoaspartate O-methyltransferase [Bradyrhizobium japonicum]CUU18601.1 ProteinLisoaspartate Omethyltransferase EC 21177 CDS [Bradyrhizobium sp.]